MPIYNCHIHTFTAGHVPSGYLPFGLVRLMRFSVFRKFAFAILRIANPFEDRDQLERYANILKTSFVPHQRVVFKKVKDYYDSGTRFIVLPMDFEFMCAGPIDKTVTQQHDELAELRDFIETSASAYRIIPFVAADPRRGNLFKLLRRFIEEKQFRGIKIYPPLGYRPDHEVLYRVYEYAQTKNLPIMAHCSRGGARNRSLQKERLHSYTDPDNYIRIMDDFPDLRICMAHFGGHEEWDLYLENRRRGFPDDQNESWLAKILNIMRSGEYPNFYADISYTIFRFEETANLLGVLLSDPRVRPQVLFGSDFYMAEVEKLSEVDLVKRLRRKLGEDMFQQIAEKNPERYLGIS